MPLLKIDEFCRRITAIGGVDLSSKTNAGDVLGMLEA